ncbi:PREDICTED: coiled-coil domain-containing protein 146 [Mesitornis unicolor]|uniref:coiled-coil domain-containing protein 146 n=1 Tax=Mesitornis unicolor TaxID=54374 RepID=UPI000528E64E|nr:PREDICTED: coiled-coil domain-containing protein 146 [Mesitornis unicolor]
MWKTVDLEPEFKDRIIMKYEYRKKIREELVLFSAGKITDNRVAELKGKYTQLHKTVISLQESEIQLLQEAKHLSVELEQQQNELEKAKEFPEECSSEVSQIRQQLLTCQNEYDAIKRREYEVQVKMKCLQEEKRFLEREYERIPKEGVNKKIEQLKENCDELRKEVMQRKTEINAIKEDVSSKQKLMLADKKEVEELLEKQKNLNDELVSIPDVTAQLAEETEKMNQRKIDAEKKKEALNDQIEELNGTLNAIEKRTEEILQEREDVMKELDRKQILLERKEREGNTLTKLLEMDREKESVAQSDREALKYNLNKRVLERKKESDILIHKQAQKDRELQNLKKMELQLNMIYDSLEQDKPYYKRLKLEVEAISKTNGALLKRRRELQKEIEMIKKSLAEQEIVSDMDACTLKECIAEEDRLFKAQEECRNELSGLAHLTCLKVEEKERTSRDFQKAQIQLQTIINEVKRKDLELRACKRRKIKIQNKLQGSSKMHDEIENERNKCVHMLHAAEQKASEIKKRVKLIGNEIENLRNTILTKESELKKQHLKNKNNIVMRDSLKRDCCETEKFMDEMKEKKTQRSLELERLTNMVNHIEEETVQLHKKYERAIQQKYESGLLLRNREEELCILYEKMNMQEILSRNGDIEVQDMDEQIKLLKLKVAEKKRQITLWCKVLPVKNALDADLVALQIQFSLCKDKIKQMEEMFTDPRNESRKRDVGGKDPSVPELLEKIEQLEAKLVQKQKKLLETDLLYEHISRLTDRIRARAENGKRDTLLLARRTNELQKKIKDRTQKMMALVAELSMKQALASKLQQEVREKEQFLMTVSSRINQGLPPPKETEHEWLKILRNERMQKEAAEARAKHTAEEKQTQRPATSTRHLQLPRPYSGLAPFKPSETGANMRHFRKPIVKPIEI